MLQERLWIGQRVGEMIDDDRVGELRIEAAQRIALDRSRRWLPHHGGPSHHAKGIECNHRAIAIRIHHEAGLQHAIIRPRCEERSGSVPLTDGCPVAERVARFQHQEIEYVVVDEALGADRICVKRVAVPARDEEVLARERQFLRGRVPASRGIEQASRWQPPVGVAFAVDVTPIAVEH